MATSLTGLTPSTTYDALIKVGDNGPIDGTLKTLSDGLGNDLPIQASTTAVNFTGALTQSGNTLQPTLVSGTSIKTINSTTLLGSGDIAVQPTLVSGTNIKTLNSVSLLGSGDIVLAATPSGVSGAIQFSNGSAFASDATNLFWDDTNNRLGVGTNAPNTALDISAPLSSILTLRNGGTNFITTLNLGGNTALRIWNAVNNSTLDLFGTGTYLNQTKHSFCINGLSDERLLIGATTAATIKGSGSTSATTSLLVQNSAGTAAMTIFDNLSATFGGLITTGNALVTGAMRITNINTQSDSYTSIYLNNADGCAAFPRTVFVGAGAASTDASAILEAKSTTKGVLFPRMTTTQKNAIATPAAGLVVYDSTTNKLCCYNGSTWNDLF